MSRLKIFINDYKWKVQPKNTDWQYLKNFHYLKEIDPTIQIRTNQHFWSNFKANFIYCLIVLCSRFSFLKNWQFLKKLELRAFISKKDQTWADVILTHGNIPWKCAKPVIMNSGFMTDEYVGGIGRSSEIKIKSEVFKKASRIIFSNNDAVQRFNKLVPEFEEKLVSIPFLLPYLKETKPKALSDRIGVLFVGRDGKRKGLDNTSKAIRTLNEDFVKKIDIIFVTEDKVDIDVPSLKTIKCCSREKVYQLMSDADIFIMPTIHDSYGIVYIEAMAHGCAVIADNKQPRREIFRDGECGLLIDPYSVDEIANALTLLIENSEMREDFKNKSLKVYNEEYNPKDIMTKYLDLLKNVHKESTLS